MTEDPPPISPEEMFEILKHREGKPPTQAKAKSFYKNRYKMKAEKPKGEPKDER